MERRFRNRTDAGQQLAQALAAYANQNNLIVLALPRGGVPVADEVAKSLHAPMDVYIVRKLGVPGQPELAMGAIASGGVRVLNQQVLDYLTITEEEIELVALKEERELERRERVYRGNAQAQNLRDQTVILVDDGIATGTTVKSAIIAIKRQQPQQLILAVPVAPPETVGELRKHVDQLVCLLSPDSFYAVGQWYQDFNQTTDKEVTQLLNQSQTGLFGASLKQGNS
jgi:putative phosphoribosyl transferase